MVNEQTKQAEAPSVEAAPGERPVGDDAGVSPVRGYLPSLGSP